MIGPGPTIAWLALAGMSLLVLGTWQYKIGGAPGERVEGYDELGQSVTLVLGTECGEVPFRPWFGAKLRQFVGKPINDVTAPFSQEVVRALQVNEPRVTVVAVRLLGYTDGALEFEVDWKPTTPLEIGVDRIITTKVRLG